ncbi:hypothetical protein HF086_016345 [Spodoptera exigua]|uniref:5-demethoxyubiquinone hydroxylase, mitochondrial n=1 Tax=Spodoptera exigua TaxID=7107 RepID=A0A922MQD6_SPOEX|nr:hypothetical protein HF086_016345 [Spodoptera exigua]
MTPAPPPARLADTGAGHAPAVPARVLARTGLSPARAVPHPAAYLAVLDQIIRVDHAGELGADRIYAGQMAVLGRTAEGPLIQHMWDQEKKHRAKFEELINEYRVRPTALTPIWNVAGFVLGAGSALLGKEAAMACTVAVETVIVDHYNDQLRTLMEDPNIDKEILETITKFRDEEQEHHDTGIDHGAEQAPFYRAMTEVIKAGCKCAIAISKKV